MTDMTLTTLSLMGLTTILLETDLDHKQDAFISTLNRSSESLLVTISESLDFSNIEAGNIEFESVPFNLRNTIEETLNLLAYAAAEKELAIIYDIEPMPSELFEGDVTRLRQILVNLISNGIKFTYDGEIFVTVHGFSIDQYLYTLRFEVRDTGIGIPENRQNDLFNPLAQADASARTIKGTGLGLPFSKRLVELMGGSMWVESSLGEGSSFYFTTNLKMICQNKSCPHSKALALIGKWVLVVDEHETNRLILCRFLESLGMSVVAAVGRDDAIETLRTKDRFDIGIFDMHISKTDRLAKVIEDDPHIEPFPKILLTSLCGETEEQLGTQFQACISKPIKRSQLYTCIWSLLQDRADNIQRADTTKKAAAYAP